MVASVNDIDLGMRVVRKVKLPRFEQNIGDLNTIGKIMMISKGKSIMWVAARFGGQLSPVVWLDRVEKKRSNGGAQAGDAWRRFVSISCTIPNVVRFQPRSHNLCKTHDP